MTAGQIIQALQCCQTNGACEFCYLKSDKKNCEKRLYKDVLNLINHQKAEIERLQEEKLQSVNVLCGDLFNETIKIAKSEAIKEFTEKFKKKLLEFDMSSIELPDYDRGYADCKTAVEDVISDLEEEMTEE